MADQDFDSTVTLNANVDPYVQGMNQAANSTDKLSGSLTTVLDKMSQLSKKVTTGIQVVGFGTVASLTALAAAADAANNQMDDLAASSAVAGRSFSDFRNAIGAIAVESPKSRGELVQLMTTLSKLGVTSSKQADEFTRLFSKMGAATGESSQGLADQMIKLSRTMGTMDTGSVTKLSNSVVSLSANFGTSAQGAMQFANAIAPFTRAAGIGATATLGLGAAFDKAGADGMSAANTFSQITSEITNSIQDGSPVLNKYAYAVGMTAESFKKLDPAQRLVKIFDQVTASGKNAGVVLTQLGFDGTRAARAIQTVTAESGGIAQAIGIAEGGANSNAVNKGAKAAEGNISDSLAKVKNSASETAIALGQPMLGPLSALAKGFATVASSAKTIADIFSPLLYVIGPLALGVGLLGTAMKGLAAAQLLVTASGTTARGAIGAGTLAGFRSARGVEQSTIGGRYAEMMRPGYVPSEGGRAATAWERGFYNTGRAFGSLTGGSLNPTNLSSQAASLGLRGVSAWNYSMAGMGQQLAGQGPDRNTPMQNLINRAPGWVSPYSGGGAGGGAAGGPGMMPTFGRNGLFGGEGTFKERLNAYTADRAYSQQVKNILNQTTRDLRGASPEAAREIKEAANKQLASLAKPSEELGKAMKGVGTNLLTWQKGALTDVVKTTAALTRGMAGAVSGIVALPTLAITAGLVTFQQAKKAKEAEAQASEISSKAVSLSPYFAQTGTTPQSQVSFKSLQDAKNKAVAKNQNISEAATLTNQEIGSTTQGRAFTDPRLKKMGPDEILAFLRANNFDFKNNPALLANASLDITQALGSTKAQEVLNQYMAGGTAGSPMDNKNPLAGGTSINDWRARSKTYQRELKQGGFATRNFGIGGPPQGLTAAIGGDVNQIENRAGAISQSYGEAAGVAAKAQGFSQIISGLQIGGAGVNNNWITRGLNAWGPTWATGKAGGAGAESSVWSSFFRNLEDTYNNGERLGLSEGEFLDYASRNNLDVKDPKKRTLAISGYLQTKGTGGKTINDAILGKYAGMSDQAIQRDLNQQFANPNLKTNESVQAQIKTATAVGGRAAGRATGALFMPGAGGTAGPVAQALAQTGNQEKQYAAAVEISSKYIKAANGNISDAVNTLKALAFQTQNTPMGELYKGALNAAQPALQRQQMALTPTQFMSQQTAANASILNAPEGQYSAADKSAAQQAITDQEGALRQFLLNIQNFNKSITRAEQDFSKQQKYAREDYGRALKYMVEDIAKSSNGYTRPGAQTSISGKAFLQNENRKTDLLDKQLANLRKAKALGISNAVIQQLDLANPANQAQLERFLKEWEKDPAEVKAFNKAEAKKIQSTSDMMKSGFVDAFNRTDQQFKTSMSRMSDSFAVTMSRSKNDFNDTMNGMTGNLETLFNRATSKASTGIKALGRTAKKNLQETFDAIYSVKVTVSDGDNKTTPAAFTGGGNLSYDANGKLVDPAPASDSWPSNTPRIAKPEDFGDPGFVPKGYEGAKYKNYVWKKDGDPISGYQNWGYVPRAYGGQVDAGKSYVVGEKGPELLQGVSGHIVPSSSFQSSVARETVQMMRVAGFANQTTYKGAGTTTVDNSTKIMGGQFTVVTSDPNDMGRQLKGKERLDRLRTGKR